MTRDRSQDIAVTGMAARLPGSGDFPVRWRAPHTAGPRHRLMLEAVRRALGDTGPEPYAEAASTGVYAAGAVGPGHAARRIAHRLGLTGPVRDFPAAHGSALVTVRAAVEALRAGECDLCVVVAGHGSGGRDAGRGAAESGAACLVLRRLDELPARSPRPYGLILDAAVAPGADRAGGPGADTVGLAPLVDALLLMRGPGAGRPAPARVGDARAHVVLAPAPRPSHHRVDGAPWTAARPVDLAPLRAAARTRAEARVRELPPQEPDGCGVRAFVVGAWCELLRLQGGLTDHSDFFARGGDSLLVTRLARRISREFGVEVTAPELSRRNLGDQVALVRALRARRPGRVEGAA
ncbi:beta-ketoacyl synthase N-terminal-like domain-containing protein [Streptomyces sp. NPDC048606]|uniref:beta-ketoacyl synthase N-terminal-like domain-containing protein n=1 Tax=Streptomyces sp. NPDC048606 TaxID=3154726 RepID=UPI003443643A